MNRNAFTLIELLVVVAIIGILAAVGVVAYSGYTSSAKVSTVQSNFKMIEKLINSEILKCEMGDSFIFEDNIACAKSHPSKNSARDGGQMRDGMYAYFLDKIKKRVEIINDPTAIRNVSEKLFSTKYQKFMPDTIFSQNIDEIRKFFKKHGNRFKS